MPDWKYTDAKPEVVTDTECYPNYWSIGFKNKAGKKLVLERTPTQELNRREVARVFRKHRVFTFNGLGYDIPMILYAMQGATNEELKLLNDTLIPKREKGLKGEPRVMVWQVMEKFGLKVPEWFDHIDLMPIAPAAAQRASLKKYAGMMHSPKMQELPYSPHESLTPKKIVHVRNYHGNDLDVTLELRDEMAPQLDLRAIISDKYGMDFRSKSDAQCGEAVIKLKAEQILGERIYKSKVKPGIFFYKPPKYIKFKTKYMQQVLQRLVESPFRINARGYVEPPAMFGKKKKGGDDDTVLLNDGETYEGGAEIHLGGTVYKMGIGGLHSQEKKVSYLPKKGVRIVDRDVRSYYPWLMINSGFEPENMKGVFRPILKGMVLERATEKALADNFELTPIARAIHKANSESMKIFVNGIFGKTGSPFSIVYAPRMMIQTTVTGQLSILMLIEELVLRGFQVISANTDGFVTLVPDEKRLLFEAIIFDWECDTTLITEETVYRSLHSRDVNNYLAIKEPKKGAEIDIKKDVKRKGAFAPSGRGVPAAMGLKKTPDVEVCTDAVMAYLVNGTPIEDTVRACEDIRKFVTVRAVKGGGEKDGAFIAKVVRYYYSDDNPGPITYASSGNRVPSSEGAEPCMELPTEFPDNVDHAWYIREAYNILDDIGMDSPDYTLKGQKGISFAHRDGQKTLHTVNRATGVAVCGMRRKDRRENWNYFKTIPSSMRDCAKCRREGAL